MYCRHCFQQIDDGLEKCPFCGRSQEQIRVGFDKETRSKKVKYSYAKEQKNAHSLLKSILISILAFFAVIGVVGLIFASGSIITLFLLILILVIPAFKLYETIYFNSEEFQNTKARISAYIKDCNDLNRHIDSLSESALVIHKLDTGVASYRDTSNWNVKRPELRKHSNAINVHNCSLTICDNARKKPFEYICKYFGVEPNEETLETFESMLNNFEAAIDGKKLLKMEREEILESIEDEVPYFIKKYCSAKLEKNLGFDPVDFYDVQFPKYIFRYTSKGGNTSTQCDIVMNIDNLNKFVYFLSEKIKFRKSVAGQRALMTSKLRTQIKERDNYTCRKCHLSIEDEPNLLLEIDHIIPVSKGGLTTPENLQTLCWRCNRSKGARM